MNEITKGEGGLGRAAFWLLAAAIGVLAATLETGRLHAQNTAFTFLGALSNVITPNGDGLNDRAFFCFDNPRDSDVSGVVYDLRGARVARLLREGQAGCPLGSAEKLTWDGRADGHPAAGGIYLYQIQAEGQTITGTVMVVR
ncbi:MAG: gliding motility-associated C-terminal domain-containing protein [Elusimicrobia bacterium]|nr:gliding motility-associated C-terminal domain-containing protein [Elusimicrobiota bacterium]